MLSSIASSLYNTHVAATVEAAASRKTTPSVQPQDLKVLEPLRRSGGAAAPMALPAPEAMAQTLEEASPETLQANHGKIQKFLTRQNTSLDLFKDLVGGGLKHDELHALPDISIDQRSEFSRSIDDDTREVLQGFKSMSAEELQAKKAAAYQHPEVLKDKPEAIASGYYGSEKHKQYGALVSQLTAGILSAEEAMAMNPSGGIPGSGMDELPLLGSIDAVSRHAMRHDATGFLISRFDVGPGYGTATTPLGRDKRDPLAGQWLGVLREAVSTSSILPDTSGVGAPVEWV